MSAKHLQNLFPVASNGSAQLRWLETSESHCATASTPSTATCASIALAVLLSAVAFVLFRYPNNAIGSRPRPDLRGPNGLPLLGNLLLMLKLKDPHGWQLKAQQQYGPGYSFTLPGLGRLIDVSRPDWIEHVQKTNFNGYAKGDSFHRMMKDVLGSGIFNVDGDQWKAQRKLASRIFTVKAFSNIILSVIREDTEQLDRILVSKAQSGEVFNIQELFFRFTLSTFVKIAFNQDTGVLANADEPDEFGEAFNYAQKVLDMRFVKPFWAFTELFNERGRKMRAARKVIDDFTHKIVGERLQNAEACRADDDQLDKPEGLDLLDLFIKYRTKSGLPLDPQSLKDAILNLMIAGRDTTAEALSWMTWRLTTSPETLAYVKSEIEDSRIATGTLDIEYGDLKQHPRKTATLYETLRLHPSIPKNIRYALADDVLPSGGPRIEKGDIVLYSDWAMGRSTAVWGPDAQQFKPSRWVDEQGSVVRHSPSKAHFFSAGPHACLGSTLATFEVCQVINLLFGKYQVELVDLGPKLSASATAVPEYLNSLTHPMKRPLMVKVSKL